MALDITDRLLTVVVTATLTSAAWIVVGSGYFGTVEAPAPAASPAPRTATAVAERGSTTSLLLPVDGIAASQLTDTFNETRGGTRRHEALDILAPAGTPVLAAAEGEVEKLFKSDAGGNTVYIRSPDRRTLYYYAHLQAYAPGLREGSNITQGQRLGTVGSTGNADPAAPHLHFAVKQIGVDAKWWEPATAINPYPLLVAKR